MTKKRKDAECTKFIRQITKEGTGRRNSSISWLREHKGYSERSYGVEERKAWAVGFACIYCMHRLLKNPFHYVLHFGQCQAIESALKNIEA
jgi:hypothetical protein